MPEVALGGRQAERTGFYGKVPVRGDFVGRRLPRAFLEPWDTWLNAALRDCEGHFGEAWPDLFLTSPIWRFSLGAGLCGAWPTVGVMMPNVDAVGRIFPLVVAARLDSAANPFAAFAAARAWFETVERLALTSLEDDFDLQDFDRALEALVTPRIAGLASSPERPRHGAGARRLYPLTETQLEGAPDSLWADLLHADAEATLEAYGLWVTYGSDRVRPVALCYGELPPPEAFRAYFDGVWA